MSHSETDANQESSPSNRLERKQRPQLARSLQAVLDEPRSGESAAGDDIEEGRDATFALLEDGTREHATDLHLDPLSDGILLRMRVHGVLLDCLVLPPDQGARLVNQLKTLCGLNPTPVFTPQVGRTTVTVEGAELDMRLTAAPCLSGDKLSIRLLDSQSVYLELEELGLRDQDYGKIEDWLEDLSGMFVVAGPTGGGKTTTLYSLLHRLKVFERHLVTVEDPVEYQITGVNQIQTDVERGLTFAEGVKAMLRLDPDYMLVGEVRDRRSARAAADAATSGKGLMTTLHSRDAIGVVSVLRNYGLTDLEISANLSVVVSQRLVRTLCEHCRVQDAPTQAETRWLKAMGVDLPDTLWHPKGCERCNDLGFSGRTGVFEIWQVDDDDYELILEHADEHTLQQRLADRGHQFLLDDAVEKLERGVTTVEELRLMGGFGSWRRNRRKSEG